MNTISDIMFWISNGLLVPDIVLLIFFIFPRLAAGRQLFRAIPFHP